jgi:hypothetical protein
MEWLEFDACHSLDELFFSYLSISIYGSCLRYTLRWLCEEFIFHIRFNSCAHCFRLLNTNTMMDLSKIMMTTKRFDLLVDSEMILQEPLSGLFECSTVHLSNVC